MEIEISKFQEEGYQPIVDYKTWRVAVLKYCEELEIQNLKTMQKHMESDEVFVLLEGSCTLFSAGNGENPAEINVCKLEPLRTYNVKQGVWHTHTLEKGANVLIVENVDTCDENSPTKELSIKQIKELQEMYKDIV
ncbi:hypothetical protein lbkm_3768 [Lachnospiraceae bacterium KM106-2]|nr:hypothetical protein lbkm_3768 [Lachnospiraceae bacterium KM106-2]